MANKHRGQVALEADGETYVVSFSVNAMCELEELQDRSVVDIMTELEKVRHDFTKLRMQTVRSIVWAALRDHHPDTSMKDAGDIISAAGVPVVMAKIAEAIMLGFPQAPAGSAEGKAPAKARARG